MLKFTEPLVNRSKLYYDVYMIYQNQPYFMLTLFQLL
jgi:hypothetical protein